MDTREEKGEIVIYKDEDGRTVIDVRLEGETIWLTQKQIAALFGTQRPAITKHLGNIFKSKELREDSVSSILEQAVKNNAEAYTEMVSYEYQYKRT